MAATVSSPWSKPGAWALDAEEHEAELQQEADNAVTDFPSLAVAATSKQPKKKKNQTLSLAEFTSYSTQSSNQPKGLTHDDLLNLPTGPRQRSAEELERTRLGGGFRSYGLNSRNGDDSSNSRWGSGGGSNNSRVSNREASREHAPSRADEIDDWSKMKKTPTGNGFDRRERGSFFESQSKADEADSWVANKPSERSEPARRFGSSNGGFEKRGSFDSLSRDRFGGGADSDNWGRKKEDSNGTSGGSSRPKLVLQPRSLPVSNSSESIAKPKGSNPFGSARPREEVLAEKGKDWKEIDEKLEAVKINAEVEKSDRGDASSFGWRNQGRDRAERSWRKPNGADTNSHGQSAEKVENGHAVVGEPAAGGKAASEDGHSQEN